MRPASEIHSSLEIVETDLAKQSTPEVIANLTIVRDVLRWVAGAHWVELTDGVNPWLVAYLLDDPEKTEGIDPRAN